jgi:ubiquinone/menaquinone biosynthesis C-methylase UbiE
LFDIERFLEEKMNPVFRAYYSIWVHYWPLWRSITSRDILKKWDKCSLMREGQTVLDFGCGTGDFTIPAARIVKESGKVYALDYFQKQLGIVRKRTEKAGLKNVETIHSDCETNLPDESVDVIWMCDVLHEIAQRRSVLEELHRVLKTGGSLAIYDGMGDKTLEFTENLFFLEDKDSKFLRFTKIND